MFERRYRNDEMGRLAYGPKVLVEPVFGNIQNKGLRRFTLRGKRKVDTQWKLFTLVHNSDASG